MLRRAEIALLNQQLWQECGRFCGARFGRSRAYILGQRPGFGPRHSAEFSHQKLDGGSKRRAFKQLIHFYG